MDNRPAFCVNLIKNLPALLSTMSNEGIAKVLLSDKLTQEEKETIRIELKQHLSSERIESILNSNDQLRDSPMTVATTLSSRSSDFCRQARGEVEEMRKSEVNTKSIHINLK